MPNPSINDCGENRPDHTRIREEHKDLLMAAGQTGASRDP